MKELIRKWLFPNHMEITEPGELRAIFDYHREKVELAQSPTKSHPN